MDHAFARGLRIEQPVRFLGLLELPAVREEAVDVDAAIGDVAGAVGLADGREGPRADQRDLPAQQIVADVQGDGVAFADEAGLAPGAHAAHGVLPRHRR